MSCNAAANPASPAVAAVQTYDGLTFVSHMIAGAAAGSLEHIAMYPVDTIKTRMQALSHPGQNLHNMSVYGALKKAIRREGVTGLYKGVGAVAAGAGPAHAVHFAVYEHAKQLLGGNEEGLHPLRTGAAGALATITNDALMTPADVVKQRLQVRHSPYTGVIDCVRKMLAHEGIGAFYKSYKTTLFMNIPFTAVHFSVYETAKKLLVSAGYGGSSNHSGSGSSGSSSSSGGSSSGGNSSLGGSSTGAPTTSNIPASPAGAQHAVALQSLPLLPHPKQHAQHDTAMHSTQSTAYSSFFTTARADSRHTLGSVNDSCQASQPHLKGLQGSSSESCSGSSGGSSSSCVSSPQAAVSPAALTCNSNCLHDLRPHTADQCQASVSESHGSTTIPISSLQQLSTASLPSPSGSAHTAAPGRTPQQDIRTSQSFALSALGPWDPLYWLTHLGPTVALAESAATPAAPKLHPSSPAPSVSHAAQASSFKASSATGPKSSASFSTHSSTFSSAAALTASSPMTATAVFELEQGSKRTKASDEDEGEETLLVQVVAGGLAGGCASAVTTPFDVVKTRLQTEGVASAARYDNNVLRTMRRIAQDEGFSALWRGLKPRVLFNVPSAAVCFGTYETMKTLLADWDRGSS